jgi:hypothetical protein
MFKTLFLAIVISLSLLSSPVRACDTQLSATSDSTCVVLPYMSKRGVWFELTIAEQLRYEHALVPHIQQALDISQQTLKLYQQKDLVDESIDISSQKVENSLRAENKRLTSEVEVAKQRSWYESKTLWYLAGVGSAVAVVIVAKKTLDISF